MMVQFKILSGKMAGSTWETRRFPVRIGRAAGSDLRLEEAGVWDEHFEVGLEPGQGFIAKAHEHAIASINGQPIQRVALRNGDTIEIGSVKLRFSLSEARQRGQGFREVSVWSVIVLVCLAQIGLVYWLLTQE